MLYSTQTWIKLSATLLALSAASKAVAIVPVEDILLFAQSPSPTTFPVPSSLPDGSTFRVDGSTSMRVINEALKERFEQQFSGTTVELAASSSDEAIEALLAGEIDLAAIGRPLTEEERARGLVEVPISREKIAIIVGTENPFEENLTFEQFAQMFRGEITDWSEVGGEPGAIRFVDRPDYSDTRRALSQYDVFEGAPFETGSTAVQVADDETATVINELGSDGISYAIASQVLDQDNVTIIPMHQTLPDDPRYPYSQPRGYVYREGTLSPAAQAFLGFATSEPGQEVVEEAIDTEAAAVAGAAGTAAAGSTAAISPSPETETALAPAAQADGAAVADRGGFPWWLLAIPILGGLLWWFLKGRGAKAPVAAPVAAPAATPAVIPPVVPPVAETSRMVLTPRNCRDAYAYWEIPDSTQDDLRQHRRSLKLRLYDVTEINLERQSPHSTREFDCIPGERDLHLPIAQDDRDYLAELGYYTGANEWVKLVRSDHVRVPACPPVNPTDGAQDGIKTAAAVGGVALAGAAAAKALIPDSQPVPNPELVSTPVAVPESVPVIDDVGDSRIVLTPRDAAHAYAYWEAPERHKAAIRAKGGRELQLRLYDATDLDLETDPAHSVQVFEIDELDNDRHLEISVPDRDYVAEIGYVDDDGKWLLLARSNPVRVVAPVVHPAPVAAAIGGAAVATTLATQAIVPSVQKAEPVEHSECTIANVSVHSKHNSFLLDEGQMRRIQDEIAVSTNLNPGSYIVRIKEGLFRYQGSTSQVGEPLVLLWIYGGKVVNQKTNVPVAATWSTLNGYNETLNLDVLEPCRLCAFFVDTHLLDNDGEVTLSVVKL
jgi:phosphate transport system substrate-binding protein